MKITILGAGTVGKTLAKGWLNKGHSIVIGTRNPGSEKSKNTAAEIGPSVIIASISDATASADAIVLTTPWEGTEETVKAAASNLQGKILWT